jgi:hypothetical protein
MFEGARSYGNPRLPPLRLDRLGLGMLDIQQRRRRRRNPLARARDAAGAEKLLGDLVGNVGYRYRRVGGVAVRGTDMSEDENKLYDVIAVTIAAPHTVRILARNKTECDAVAIIRMAVFRRGVDVEFYITAPSGMVQ